MSTERISIRINAERLGTVKEVRKFLKDLEQAYKSIYGFIFLVDILYSERERKRKLRKDHYEEMRRYFKEIYFKKNFPYDPLFFEFFWERNIYASDYEKINLLEVSKKLKYNKLLLAEDELILKKVNIQSPGFWEFLGSLNPMEQLREYLNDRHERAKDKNYRMRQEEELGELSILEKKEGIIKQRIETLKSLGYSDLEIKQLVNSLIVKPLNKLGKHIDKGLIEGAEDKTE